MARLLIFHGKNKHHLVQPNSRIKSSRQTARRSFHQVSLLPCPGTETTPVKINATGDKCLKSIVSVGFVSHSIDVPHKGTTLPLPSENPQN